MFLCVECPHCDAQHVHGWYALYDVDALIDMLRAFGGCRASNCGEGIFLARRRVSGDWRFVSVSPRRSREPAGHGYRLVLAEPAAFTRAGSRSREARGAMIALARRGIPVSCAIWTPRYSCLAGLGDR